MAGGSIAEEFLMLGGLDHAKPGRSYINPDSHYLDDLEIKENSFFLACFLLSVIF